MSTKQEITAIDYDRLLTLFCGTDRIRPAMQQPNTIGDITYATDSVWLIMIPNNYLRNVYPAHKEVPDFKSVLDYIKEIEPIVFKDTDLFKAMQVHPREYDFSDCDDCEGNGNCPHCGHRCDECSGTGVVEDTSAPMVLSKKNTIQIHTQRFTPFRLSILERTVAMLMVDTFELVGYSGMASKFKVGPVHVLMARVDYEENEYPNHILLPITKTNEQ